ncbi:Irc18p PWA37_001554 [Arxiozyma heterogenica]|uniref:Irc18p n=1 Tax=Arxiozyma heterogenica TaxID=278026 RepID=UPI002EE8A4AE
MYLMYIGLLIFFTANPLMALNTNECTYNSTKLQLVNLLSNFSNNIYKNNISIIENQLEECYNLYKYSSSNSLFFLEKLLKDKINNITATDTLDIRIHIKSLNKGLTYAINVKPYFFKREALSILIKNLNTNLNNLLSIFQKTSVHAYKEEGTIIQSIESFTSTSTHPKLQKILKDSIILFILFGSIADVCVVPHMTICPMIVLVGLISSALWMFQINDIFNGIFL